MSRSGSSKEFIKSTPFDLRGDAAIALIVAMRRENFRNEVGYITRYGIYNGKLENGCEKVSVIRTEWGKRGSSVMNYMVCKGKIVKSVSSTGENVPQDLKPVIGKVLRKLKNDKSSYIKLKKDGYVIEGLKKSGVCEVKVLSQLKLLYYYSFTCR
ncbi:hypothetical protein [Desulfurobacterium sp.]